MLPGTIHSEKKCLNTGERSTGEIQRFSSDFAVLVVVLFLAKNMIADSLCLRALDTLLLMLEGRDEFE